MLKGLRKVFIVITLLVAFITTICINNKDLSIINKPGFISKDTYLQLENTNEKYYACKGTEVFIYEDLEGNSLVEVNSNVRGYINSNYISYNEQYPDICKGSGVSSGVIREVNKQLLVIPQNILSEFKNTNWKLIATNLDLNEEFYDGEYSFVYGSTSYKEKTIYISNSVEAAKRATLHEFGHWVDWSRDYISQTDDFYSIFIKEGDEFKDYYNLSIGWDEREFFAEGFMCYYTDRLELKDNFPLLYSCISDTLQYLS